MIPPDVFMRFRPSWAFIDGVREFGRFFCEATFGTKELAERARVVLQETLENAIKYSAGGPASELELEITARGDHIEFAISSVPAAEHLHSLKQELALLGASDSKQAYLAAIRRAANPSEPSSRLGLARVRYEGGVELSMEEELGGRIRLTAVGKL